MSTGHEMVVWGTLQALPEVEHYGIVPNLRLVVKDESGRQMPLRKPFVYLHWIAARNSSTGMLQPGTDKKQRVRLQDYMDRLPPGRYKVIVQYHTREPIMLLESVDHLLVVESQPIELEVLP